jgi:flagellin-specific chaperone FliS
MYQAAYRNQEYRDQEVMGASPLHLVVMAYDLAIRACEQQDFEKAVRTISVLRDALDFDYPEVSEGLFRLYQWCLDCIRKGDYASAMSVLNELRDAWRTTERSLNQSRRPAAAAVVPDAAPAYAGRMA